jgi:hypothetical protein
MVPLSAVLHDLGGELRKTGSVKFPVLARSMEFRLGHNTIGKAVDKDAVASSVGTIDSDA